MQTFSDMQRSRFDQNTLVGAATVISFTLYEALSMQFLYLPPLFGILFFLMISALDAQNLRLFLTVSGMLMIAEVAKGYVLFGSVVFYTFSYFIVLPRVRNVVSCRICLNAIIVTYAYMGYWGFQLLLSRMFAQPTPMMDGYVFFYLFIEILLTGLL